MEIKKAELNELPELIEIYKEAFEKHNVFEQSDAAIQSYLESTHSRDEKKGRGYLIAVDDGKVIGGLLVSKTASGGNKHSTWKYRHVAVGKGNERKGVGSALVKEADAQIKKAIEEGKIRTARVEITIAEGEKEMIPFYEKNGFKQEATHENYYRWGEQMYELVKFFSTE